MGLAFIRGPSVMEVCYCFFDSPRDCSADNMTASRMAIVCGLGIDIYAIIQVVNRQPVVHGQDNLGMG